MCGISGIIESNKNFTDFSEIKRMNDLIIHRGPDAEGFYTYQNLALGHRRLSILDLTEVGNQPMTYDDNLIITYNGEIYNYIELRDELLSLGYKFKTKTDTEVILASYKEWGENCLQRFNGMWAFALLDKKSNTLLLSRDRFGVKPLYFSENAGNFKFGSEIKQLLNNDSNQVNLNVLIESMLTFIDNHTSNTYFKGIYSLLPGHSMVYDLKKNSYKINKYYELKINDRISKLSKNNAVDYLLNLFTSAVKLRLRSDVRVGSCLSGGLDSSAVSAISCFNYDSAFNQKFIGIHARSIDKETDESLFAKDVSKFLDLNLHIVTPSVEDFKLLIDEVVYTQEEPFGSPSMFMGYKVFEKAKELDCKVMLNGQGGDEVLLGYERYFSSYLYTLGFWKGLKELWKQSRNSRLKFYEPVLYLIYFTSFKVRKFNLQKRSFLRKDLKNSFDFCEIKRSIESFKNISSLQINEISNIQLPHLLRYEDRNSMRHSIETRLPFLDFRIVEAGISFLPHFKIRNGWTKYIFRLALKEVIPEHIVWRKNKLGFNAPERSWLSAHKDSMVEEIAKSELLKSITDFEKLVKHFPKLSYKDQWLYYNIAVWERIYKVKL